MNYTTFKHVMFFALFVFSSLVISAQKTWLDNDWTETSKEKANFYRVKPKKTGDFYAIKHFYKSDNLLLEGQSKTAYPSKDDFNGVVKIYFETGELKEERFFNNGIREGVWKTFHKTGKIKTKGKYRNGEKVGVWKTFYKNVYEDFLPN